MPARRLRRGRWGVQVSWSSLWVRLTSGRRLVCVRGPVGGGDEGEGRVVHAPSTGPERSSGNGVRGRAGVAGGGRAPACAEDVAGHGRAVRRSTTGRIRRARAVPRPGGPPTGVPGASRAQIPVRGSTVSARHRRRGLRGTDRPTPERSGAGRSGRG